MSIADAIGKLVPGGLAEGVGFEPTVGCPTLDFESSALNRTQPPFHVARSTVDQAIGCERYKYGLQLNVCKLTEKRLVALVLLR
jgi:hypothetical protein